MVPSKFAAAADPSNAVAELRAAGLHVELIDDPADVSVAAFSHLTDRRARELADAQNGTFVAEGVLVVARALELMASGRLVVDTVVANSAGLSRLRDSLLSCVRPGPDSRDLPRVLLVPTPVLREVAGFNVHRGVLALVRRWPLLALDDLLADPWRLVLAAEDVVDGENMGALFRNGSAFGVDAIVVSQRSIDPLYRRCVRVSMGESMSLPWTRVADSAWPDALLGVTRAAGAELVVLSPAGERAADDYACERAEAAATGKPLRPLLVAVGSEGPGASDELLAAADVRVRIPMRRSVDSLNVATAAAVALYALTSAR